MRSRLTKVADVIIALSCLTVAGLLIEQRFFRTLSTPAERVPNLVGQRLREIADVPFDKSEHTLLIVMRSTCRFCDASVPFWQRVMDSRRSVERLRVVAVSDEPVLIAQDYLRRHGLELDAVVSAKIPTPGTPTLILVDAKGVVKATWPGRPPDKGAEDSILKFLPS